MKLSRTTSLFVLCAVTFLATAPTGIIAQLPTLPGRDTSSSAPAKTSAAPNTSTTSRAATSTPVNPPVVTSSAAPTKPVVNTPAPVKPTSLSALPTGPATTAPTTCRSTADCVGGTLCQLTVSGSTNGTCGAPAKYYCKASTPQVCTAISECTNPAYSTCMDDPEPGAKRKVCVGLGDPVLSPCPQDDPKAGGGGSGGNITQTLMYAGIGVGSVAAFAIVFALVRWQRRRQRSKMPENMFGEVDYGMTDRSSTKAEPYAFSSRAAAQGSDNYEDNYYQGGGGGGGGGGGYHKDQYYDDQNYGHDGYGNGGGYGHGGHGHNDGYYDNSGYDDYNQPAAPARAMSPRGGDYQMDHYGAEPSEMDYGGHGHGHGGQGGGGYGRY
ncbi:hypothetical protein BGZ93_001868 [Podila epicladia]|nr:hypothetical protein BGZ92_010378 [Podila epicladia]KAG0097828.1 hypothetical protein BGZ93_001868 [Podila epicladia]